MSDLVSKLLILRTPRIGPAKYNELIRKFGSAAAAVDAVGVADTIRDAVMREMDMAAKIGAVYVCDDDENYPPRLRDVRNHPPVLAVRGNVATLRRDAVAMVGTRHSTAAGMMFMGDLACGFATRGVAVVSGMAMGTDAAAHRGALRADGDANTIAVVAGGVDYIWPTENESLYYEIIARGAVVSEMPIGFVPVASNFIMRNRWVAGIAGKMILGEADLKSGSIATARFAIEYGRDLWAIPSHPSDARAAGPNSLIASGDAKLCSGITDFFQNSCSKDVQNKKTTENDDAENMILDKLGSVPVSESVLTQVVKMSVSEIKRELVVLELRGLVRKTDGGYVRV